MVSDLGEKKRNKKNFSNSRHDENSKNEKKKTFCGYTIVYQVTSVAYIRIVKTIWASRVRRAGKYCANH